MTSQGRHRTRPHTKLTPFLWGEVETLRTAITNLEAKRYEVREVRLQLRGHGGKTTVVLHLSPAPGHGLNTGGEYRQQDVGKTARRNLETLLAYVEGLPDVRPKDRAVDSAGGVQGVHDDTPQGPGKGGA